jgi:hypothetical protein
MDWILDLVTTCIHHSELQLITALLLIYTITPRKVFCQLSIVVVWWQLSTVVYLCNIFTKRFLLTNLNKEDSPASVVASLLPGEYPTTKLQSQLYSLQLASSPSRPMLSVSVFSWHSKVLFYVGVSMFRTSDHIYDTLIGLHTNQVTMDTTIVFLDNIHIQVFI